MNTTTIERKAEELGVDPTNLRIWITQIAERAAPKLTENPTGEELTQAVTKAHEELQALMMELAVGKSPRARVARSYITWKTYFSCRGHEGDELERMSFEMTLQDSNLQDLDVEGEVRRSLESLGL